MNKKVCTIILLSVLLFLFYSCNKYSHYSKWIIGEWVSDNGILGYYFVSKDTCEVRPGYIDQDFMKHPRKYFGNRTTYQISNDTLKIFDLLDNHWKNYKISFPSPATMILLMNEGKNSYQIEYEKAKYSISDENLFDQVVICNHSFRRHITISIDSSGIFLCSGFGWRDNDLKGFHISNNGKYAFKQIERLFKEANSKHVFIHAFPARADSINGREASITFIKNNQMVTIAGPMWGTDGMCGTDYENYIWKDYLSTEFMWAYEQSMYLEQQVPIQPFTIPDHWSHSENYFEYYYGCFMPVFYFESNDKPVDGLYTSEKFYLWTQILKAKQVDADFTPAYTVNDHIQSDGRYYRYKTERGDTITLDLGFNFIEVNNLAGKFRER